MSTKGVDPGIIPGKRFRVDSEDGEKGTVRYVGTVKGSKKAESIFVGVEWDEEGRGKNDGSSSGERYFSCPAGKGSFIHPKRIYSLEKSIMQAIRDRYNASIREEDLYLNAQNSKRSFQVAVEFVGADKVQEKLCKLDELTKISVSDSCVGHEGDSDELSRGIPACLSLDLDNNLLRDWKVVLEVGRQLPLEEIQLSNNNLDPHSFLTPSDSSPPSAIPALITRFPESPFRNLRNLFLNRVPRAWSIVTAFNTVGWLDCLEKLHLCQNSIEKLPDISEGAFANLILLNLDENKLSDWGEVQKLAYLPKVEQLLLNGNQLPTIAYDTTNIGSSEKVPFGSLQSLSLNDNKIGHFDHIEQLNLFPKLTQIRLQNTPLTKELNAAVSRAYVIARMPKLAHLNLSSVPSRERVIAEKQWMKFSFECMSAKTANGDKLGALRQARYKQLEEIHGAPNTWGVDGNRTGTTLRTIPRSGIIINVKMFVFYLVGF